jgi:hypothetical protein
MSGEVLARVQFAIDGEAVSYPEAQAAFVTGMHYGSVAGCGWQPPFKLR